MSGLSKELQFLLQRQLTPPVIVYHSDALNDLIMIFLYQSLCSHLANGIKLWISDSTQVFQQVRPQTMDQALDIVAFTHILHAIKPRFNLKVVVDGGFIN